MALRYANGYRPRGGARELLKESLADLKEQSIRLNAPYWLRGKDKTVWWQKADKKDLETYAEMLGISVAIAKRRISKQAETVNNFQEWDL